MRPRTPEIGRNVRREPSFRPRAGPSTPGAVNVTETFGAAVETPAQSGRYRVGSARSTVALPSPSGPQAGNPPLKIHSGFTPKNAGVHRMMSAMRPGWSEPTCAEMPCVTAGSIVSFAR